MPSYRNLCDHKDLGCLQLLSKGFQYFEVNCYFLAKFFPRKNGHEVLDVINIHCYCC